MLISIPGCVSVQGEDSESEVDGAVRPADVRGPDQSAGDHRLRPRHGWQGRLHGQVRSTSWQVRSVSWAGTFRFKGRYVRFHGQVRTISWVGRYMENLCSTVKRDLMVYIRKLNVLSASLNITFMLNVKVCIFAYLYFCYFLIKKEKKIGFFCNTTSGFQQTPLDLSSPLWVL